MTRRIINGVLAATLVGEVFLVTVLGLWGQVWADLSPVRMVGLVILWAASWGLLEYFDG